MRGGVFISYRREDSAGFAGRIYDRLRANLGPDSVFIDVDNIPAGLDFVEVLSERVGRCDALIALIGKNWIASADRDNRRRLDDPNDFVRIEIEAALERNVPVIPVLVDGATMPRGNDLPDGLKKLARRQGIEISHNRFDSDAERLTEALARIEEEASQGDQGPRLASGGGKKRPLAALPDQNPNTPRDGVVLTPKRARYNGATLAFVFGAIVIILAVATGLLMRGSTESSTADVEKTSAATPAPAAPDATASAATRQSITDPSILVGPASKLLGDASSANAAAPASKESLTHEIEQQTVALANASQDTDRLTQEANAAVQDIKTDTEPTASTKLANAAPGGSTRYRATDCGSIADTKSGTEWYVGPDKDFAWGDANNWVHGLSACGKRWTMPSVDDVRSLYDKELKAGSGYYSGGRNWPAHIDPIFSAIGGGSWVWTRGSVVGGNAPAFNLNQNLPVQISAGNSAYPVRAFAVAK